MMRARLGWLVLVLALALVPATPGVHAQSAPSRLTFTKVFPGSGPEYIRITVDESGAATYQGGSLDDKGDVDDFQLSSQTVSHLFGLAQQLKDFRGIKLESGKNVARMGEKTFAYDGPGGHGEVSYNYTTDATAEQLRTLFEQIAQGRYLIRELEHRLVYDRLGLMETMRRVERTYNAGQLVDPEQFIPVLERIANNTELMNLVQQQARALRRRIGGAPARLELELRDRDKDRFARLVLDQGGATMFENRRIEDPVNMQSLELPDAAKQRLWTLARAANYFRGMTGDTTYKRMRSFQITYESGAEHNQMTFSSPPTAIVAEMVHILEQTMRQEDLRERLRTAVAQQSIMIQVDLQELAKAIQQDELVDPHSFIPLLEQIAQGSAGHPRVRQQAEQLLASLNAPTGN